MKIREATTDMKDFLAFDELYFRTNYSHEIGVISPQYVENQYFADPPYTYKEYCEAVVEAKYMGDYCIMFEDDNGTIIGCAIIDIYKPTLEISEFIIKRDYQLQGYGRKFYQLLEAKAQEQKIRIIILYSFFAGSMQFWTKMGFSQNERHFYKKIL